MKTTKAACVNDDLCCFKEEEEDGQIDDSHVERVCDHLAILSMLTVRVVVRLFM